MPWLLLFFLTPIVEMYLLIEVAGYIDAWPTIALVMLTAVVGVALLKRQGVATLTRGVQRMQQGQMPATEMAEGILLAVAGALLITPGFVTDFVGFMLLFPPSRIVIAKSLMSRVMMNGAVSADIHAAQFRAQGQKPNEDPSALDGEFQRKD
ncbi:MAG: FxsA family protein [Pseudomonadota bacterium]|nr:FxsA family protein [Pseudomonadota bacterium]